MKDQLHRLIASLLILLLLSSCGSISTNAGSTPAPASTLCSATPCSTVTPTTAVSPTSTPTELPVITPTPTVIPQPTPTPTPLPTLTADPCTPPSGISSVSPVEIDIGNTTKPQVALTFDAGGVVDPAPHILDILSTRGIHSTWFFTGAWAQQNPDILKRAYQDGHEIGNHTMTHPDLTTLSDAEVCSQLSQADQIISSYTGHSARPYFRPPFGARNAQVRQLAATLGYRTVYWTIDTLDWQAQSTPDSIITRILAKLTNGSIILMHAGSSSEAQALDMVITLLQDKGYQIVNLSQILQGT